MAWFCRSVKGNFCERNESALNSKIVEPQEELPNAKHVSLDGEKGIKTLSVSWKPNTDAMNFEVKLSER